MSRLRGGRHDCRFRSPWQCLIVAERRSGWWILSVPAAPEASLPRSVSVLPVSPRRLNGGEGIEVESDDLLECLRRGSVAEAVGQSVRPGNILSLQGEQFADGIAPAP